MSDIDQQKSTNAQLKTQKQKPQTRAEALRTQLKTLETLIVQLSQNGSIEALEIPSLFDQVDQALEKLGESGMNLASELGQFETITALYIKNRALFLRRIGGPEVLEKARQEIQPSRDRWWWYTDLTLALENKQKRIRQLRMLGISVVLLVILGLVYRMFFAPDPVMQASYGHQQRAENALIGGHLEDGLMEIQDAITLTPDNPRLYVIQGVIQEGLGLFEDALSSFETAIGKYDQDDQFFTERGTIYLIMGDPERVLADSEQAILINPDSAFSYLNMGNAYEMLGDIQNAIASFELADEIAQQSGNAQLQAIIRISLSNAYQSITIPTFDESGFDEGE
jgi:tetratricopeptide (TPR) repeat protein